MARSFNGTSDFIDVGSASVLNITGAFTSSIWLFPTSLATFNQVYSKNNGNSTYWQCYIASGGQVHAQLDGASLGNVISTNSISTNVWSHIAIARDGSNNVHIYINGADAGGSATGSNGSTTGQDLTIGKDIVNSRFWTGTLADFAIWTTNLSTLEIAGLAEGVRPIRTRPQSLIGWWPLDGLQSPEPDLSGSANNGTLTGTSSAFGPPIGLSTRYREQRLLPSAAFMIFNQILTQNVGGPVSVTATVT